jgi:hypothetical protein
VILFCLGEYGDWSAWLAVSTVMLLIMLIISYFHVYVKTGIWRMCRAKSADLDERQIAIVHDAYRSAYHIFTVVCLVLLFFIVLSVRYSFFTLTHRGHYSFGLIILMFLNFFLNTLPASIVAWMEPVIEQGH